MASISSSSISSGDGSEPFDLSSQSELSMSITSDDSGKCWHYSLYRHLYHNNDASSSAKLIPTVVLKLENMATFSVALEFWHRATVNLPQIVSQYGHDDWRKLSHMQISQSIARLPIPESVKSHIKNNLKDIMANVQEWIIYLSRKIFSPREYPSVVTDVTLYRYARHIVWYQNGVVDFKESARNLLRLEVLSDLAAFRVACTFCFREEVERRWSLLPVFIRNDLVSFWSLSRSEHHLIDYWYRFCTGTVREMPTNRYTNQCLIKSDEVDNWSAIEYFFDRLNITEQFSCAIWLIDYRGVIYQELILSKLNEIQRTSIYEARATRMVTNYFCDYVDSSDFIEQNAISTWYKVREFIGMAEFASLIKSLLLLNGSDGILTEIWTVSSDDFKLEIFKLEDFDFISYVFRLAARITSSSHFLFAVLSDCTKLGICLEIVGKKRKYYYQLMCENFVRLNDYESLSRLLNISIPNAEERIKFKLEFARSDFFKDHCALLMSDHKTEILKQLCNVFLPETVPESKIIAHDLLLHCFKFVDNSYPTQYLTGNFTMLNGLLAPLMSSYSATIQEYKRNLLFSKTGIETCSGYLFSTAKMATLDNIFNDCGLLSNVNLVNKFKKSLIFSSKNIEKLRSTTLSGKRSRHIRKVLNQCLKKKKDKKKMQKILLDH